MGIDTVTERHLRNCCNELPANPPEKRTVHGFDGYIDRVRIMVESRTGPNDFQRMRSLATLEQRIGESVALNNSCSIEWEERDQRAGGHTSHLGRAFATLGFDPTVVGTYGTPPEAIFEQELTGCSLVSIGSPSYSDAVEFNDGKFMINEIGSMETLDWETLHNHVDLSSLIKIIDGADALSTGYWSTMPFLSSIWDGLRTDIWPSLSNPPKMVFVDPADVRRMSDKRIKRGLRPLKQLNNRIQVTVSANRRETGVLASLSGDDGNDFKTVAQQAKDVLEVSRYLAHTVDRSILVTDDITTVAQTPRVAEPELTASAGDHFNAGFILGDILGLSDTASLMLGNVVANWFVRHGRPPEYDELLDFLDEFEAYFEGDTQT